MVISGPPRRREVSKEARQIAAGENPPVIVKYTNGLLVDGAFYDYASPENRELLYMLQNGEFDRDVLGKSGSHAHVVVEEQNGIYPLRQQVAEHNEGGGSSLGNLPQSSSWNVQERVLPEEVDLAEGRAPHARFKLCVNGNVTIFKIAEHLHVGDVVDYIESATGLQTVLLKNGKALGNREPVGVLDKFLIEAITAGSGD